MHTYVQLWTWRTLKDPHQLTWPLSQPGRSGCSRRSPSNTWCQTLLNRFLVLLRLMCSSLCSCEEEQIIKHVIETCPLQHLTGRSVTLHTADQDATALLKDSHQDWDLIKTTDHRDWDQTKSREDWDLDLIRTKDHQDCDQTKSRQQWDQDLIKTAEHQDWDQTKTRVPLWTWQQN